MALLRIYDVGQEPPALVSQQQFPVTSDAIVIADELANRSVQNANLAGSTAMQAASPSPSVPV